MLTLYISSTCQYCDKVMRFVETNNIQLELKDIYADREVMADLIERGGKRQVPYLADSDKNVEMYESEDIIEHLKENYVNQ